MSLPIPGPAILALSLLAAPTASDVPPKAPPPDLVVHEWGTFLGMSGSDGTSLDGMYHEEHALPGFVHARSRDQLRWRSIFTKGETPVIYFYTDREQNASVQVSFPTGIWTQWYPQAAFVLPRLASLPVPATTPPSKGRIAWNFKIVPAGSKNLAASPPAASADALWNHARDVDAAYVQTHNYHATPPVPQVERFLFYRGLGSAPLPLKMTADAGGTITADPKGPELSHLFVLKVEGGMGQFRYVPSLAPGQTITNVIPAVGPRMPASEFQAKVADALAERLVGAGLFPKEARAMVNTWKSSYFGSDGVRLLFLLPQKWTDATIPLKVEPAPKAVVRVMVGRMELLTPGRERLVKEAVRQLQSSDPAERLAAFKTLEDQGRYAEPILKRLMDCSPDATFRAACRRLLLASHVSDLRTVSRSRVATEKAPDVMMANEDPVYIRARLAQLLHEVGLDDEAKAEGRAALAVLNQRPKPKVVVCDNRHDMRALALASEASGNDMGAITHYDNLLQLGREAVSRPDCRKCHHESGANIARGLRDWWAGDAYAGAVQRLGQIDTTITLNGLTPDLDANRLRLAFLHKRAGRPTESDEAIRKFVIPQAPAVTQK